MIKAIETKYQGYRFRSRLEARWAVFLDALGVEWEYEPEGFDLGDGQAYLPDFRVKCWGTRGNIGNTPFDLWVEVKGVMTKEDAWKIQRFAEPIERPVLIVSGIPKKGCSYDAGALHSYEGMDGTNVYPFNYELIDGDHFGAFPAGFGGKFFLWGDEFSYIWNTDEVETAYNKARQARFEHGEAGA